MTLLLTSLLSPLSFADQGKIRWAKGEDLVGYWSVLLLHRYEAGGRVTNEQMFHGIPCNIHVFRNDGKMINLSLSAQMDSSSNNEVGCPSRKSQVDNGLLALQPSPTSWSTWREEKTKGQPPGIFVAEGQGDQSNTKLTWQIGYANEDLSSPEMIKNFGIEIKKGDLLVHLLGRLAGPANESGQVPFGVVWGMVLRPIR